MQQTVDGFLATDPGQRLRFAQQLGERVTPEVAALLVYTYLTTEMHAQTRQIYGQALKALIAQVDPIALFILAYRFINTCTAGPTLLAAHQEMGNLFTGLRNDQGLPGCGYIREERSCRSDYRELFTGTLGHRVLPTNLNALLAQGLRLNDCVLYDTNAVGWDRYRRRGRAHMVLVPMNDQLPTTLGL